MKRIILTVATLALSLSVYAQDVVKAGPYKLTKIYDNPTTSVKDQNRAGTCWSFATLAMIESDLIKKGKVDQSVDLAEMWVVRNTYYEKFVKYVRMQGKINFDEGAYAHDVTNMIAKYGIVRENDYKGLNYGEDNHVHAELSAVLKSFAATIITNPNRTLSTAWKTALNGILDAYFGVMPKTINVDGKEVTPKQYAENLGIVPSEYVAFASAMHHPFGEKFIYEVPDNWAWGEFNNVKLNDFVAIAKEALKNGYTISWGSDVSDKGFKYKEGYSVYPETEIKSTAGLESAKWNSDSKKKSKKKSKKAVKPTEKEITQEYRALLFDNYTATDDHAMQITGLYEDEDGALFFKVKNSWAEDNTHGGFFYASIPYFEALTMNYMVNSNALSAETKAKFVK